MSGRKRSYSTMASVSSQSAAVNTRRKKKRSLRSSKGRSIVARVAALENQVEKKYVITAISTSGVYSAVPYLLLLNPLVRGDTVQSRDGDKVMLGKGFFRGYVSFSSSFYNTHMHPIRLYVVLDRETNISALTSSILLGTAAPDATSLFNFNNYNFFKRFKILHDSGLKMPSHPSPCKFDQNNPASNMSVDLSCTWDCGTFPANYAGGNTGDVTDIRSGSVYLVLVSSRDSSATCSLFGNAVQYFKES